MSEQHEPHLQVYVDRSVLVVSDGSTETFREGMPNQAARDRLRHIEDTFRGGYLSSLIDGLLKQETELDPLEPEQLTLLETLVGSVTSEVGRGVIGLAVLLLAIKDISPDKALDCTKAGEGTFHGKMACL